MNADEIKNLQKKLRPFLILPSVVYGSFVTIRNFLYDKSLLKSEAYSSKIISVGNIAVGGVGKTPVVIELAKKLSKYGDICVIVGNYPKKDKRVHIVSVKGSIFKKTDTVSDEAYMIAKKTDITVIASKSRKAAIELAVGLGSKYIILDDALHKRSIKKDFEICVVDKEKPFEDGFYLPAGTIRDAKSSLRRCDVVICVNKSRCKLKKVECNEALIENLGVFDNKGQKIKNKPSAFVFCGIGKPTYFLKSVEECGLKIKGYKFFKDHYMYTQKDLFELKKMKNESDADILLTTYKDFVKIENEDVYYLDMGLKIEKFDELIGRIL